MTSTASGAAVVIVNFRGTLDTIACLESIAETEPRPRRVVVVENGSGDDSLERLQAWQKASDVTWLTLIPSSENRGYSGGNNLGLEHLRAHDDWTHVVLLNNDTTLEPGYFGKVERSLTMLPARAVASGPVFHFSERDRIWFGGGRITAVRALATHVDLRGHGDAPVDSDFVSGCAMIVTRAALRDLVRLPECYSPGYMEDVDWCVEARRRGIRVCMLSSAACYHKVGASFGVDPHSPRLARLLTRNRVFFARRQLRGATRLAALGYMVMTKPARALVELIAMRPRLASAFVGGLWEGLLSPRALG